MAATGLDPYRVQAFNTAKASENKIHDDDVARRFGFGGIARIKILLGELPLTVDHGRLVAGELLQKVLQHRDALFHVAFGADGLKRLVFGRSGGNQQMHHLRARAHRCQQKDDQCSSHASPPTLFVPGR